MGYACFGPLFRTLLRLRHDLVMIGRAANSLLPEALWCWLEAPLAVIGKSFADHLRAPAAALSSGRETGARCCRSGT